MLKKRILSLLLVLAMTVGMFPVVASAETTTDGPAIQSVQLVLNSVLGIKLKVALPDNDPANYTVKVQIGDSAVQTLPGSADKKEGSLYLYTARMMAHQMTDDIKISMVKGSETVIPETTWHVKSGYVDQLANKGAPEAAKLAGSMWNYGQYAAAYREAEISNAYTDPAVDAVMNAPMVDASHKLTVTQSGSVGASALLYLDEACDIVFKFSAAALEGKTLWVDDTQVETTDAGDGKVQYRIPDILPQDYATKHNVQVKAGDTVAFAMEYSVLSYIYQRQNKTYTGVKPDKDVWVDNLLASMNLYGQDAQSYKAYLAGVIQLTEANAGTPAAFAALLNADTDGHFVLAEDLDWNNAAFGITSTDSSSASVIKKFTGVLDGQGHTISNFRLGHSGDNYDSAMILENAGTIRNIGFNFTMATANSSNYGLIQTNSGLIENLFVAVSYAASQWTTGAVAAVNGGTGTIQNCITVVSTTLTEQSQKDRLGAIVGVDYNGKILNCYSVNTANSVATPYVDTWNNGTYTGSAVYASAQALLDGSAENVTADNGWSGYWRVIPGAETAGGIAFGSDIVIAGMVKEPCKHEDKAPVDDVCDLCQESVTLRDTANTVLVNMTNASTPAAFKTLINANLGKTFYLTQDLDWSGVTTQYQGVQTFSGTFDGQGYSIKNFGLAESDPGDGNWSSFLFGTNNGIIRNTGFDYSLPEAKGDSNALVWTNSGTLENLFVKAAFAGAGGKNAAVVYINASTGTVQNCIVDVSFTAASNSENIGPVVYAERSGTVKNCYVVNTANNVTTAYLPVASFDTGNRVGNAVYATAQALLDGSAENVTAENGWSGYWTVAEGGINFNGKVVVAGTYTPPAPPCDHSGDTNPCDDKCDQCDAAIEPAHPNANGDCVCDQCGASLHVDENNDCVCDKCEASLHANENNDCACDKCQASLHVDANKDGLCDYCGEFSGHPSEGKYYINTKTAATPADFVALINEDPDGNFYVTEDLDYTGSVENITGIGAFAGILDGQGHAVKGITIKWNSNDNYESNFIGTNTGTIQNIAFEYALTTINNNTVGLIRVNQGTIQNVYAKVALNAMKTAGIWAGGFVCLNGQSNTDEAVLKNCIVDLTLKDDISSTYQTGAVAATTYPASTVANCYYTYASNNVTISGVYWDQSNKATVALLSEDATVNSADGWSNVWKKDDTGLYFGDILVQAVTPACAHTDGTPSYDGKCDKCGEAYTPDGITLVNMTNAGTPAAFKTLVTDNLDKDLYLTEDLDWNNALFGNTYNEYTAVNYIENFSGILDGQGHTISNFRLGHGGSGTAGCSTVFYTNSGTIQNIGFDFMYATANASINGLIATNTGVVQNVYAKVTMDKGACESQGNTSPFVAIHEGSADAVIRNCIVDVTVDASVTSLAAGYGAVVSRCSSNSGSVVDKCYYRVTGATMPGIAYAWSGGAANTTVLSEDAAVNSEDGWSDVWKKDDTGLYFGETLILAAAPKCEHADTAHVDGLCDKCGEAVDLPADTYLINSTTAGTKQALIELINADLDGHYYVTEDLTYSDNNNYGIKDFAGVLDGQGHSITGIIIQYNANDEWNRNLFKSNSGTIKNIALEHTIIDSGSAQIGLISTNTGIIQNVYAKATVQTVKTDGLNSALVALNSGDKAVIQNCIVDVSLDTSITSIQIPNDPNMAFGAVAARCVNGAVVDNCYFKYVAAEGVTVPGIAMPWSGESVAANAKALDSSVTTLPASAGWSGYWKANAAGIWFGGKQVLDTGIGLAEEAIAVYSSYKAEGMTGETGEKPLAWFGSSEDDRANIFAWYDFQKLYQEITGEAIDVVFVDSVSELDENKTYFVLGDDLAKGAGLNTDGITTDNGHKIVKSGDDVYLYGKSGYGTANAMYAFLKQAFKAEFYSDTVYTTTGNTFSLDSISDATFNPAVDYNWAYDGLLYTNNGQAINYAYQMRMGFVNYWHILGGSHHAFSDLFAEGNYSVDIDLNAGGAIGPNSTYVQTVADYIYEKAKETGRPVIAVGHQDTHDWSTSSESKANLNTYGANSGEYLLFMNEVIKLLNTAEKYADIPAVDVSMLVYNGSLKAPTNTAGLTPNTNTARNVKLRVMFAPIEMNVNGDPDDSTIKDYYGNTPSYYYGEYAKWQNIFGADKVDFWRYSTIFNDFLVPVNTVKYIQENYMKLIGTDGSIKHMMDQGTGLSPVQTNYQALLVYLKGQLGKKPDANLETLITNFCNAYYGAGGTYIKQLLTAQQSHLTTLSTTMNNTSTGFLGTGKKADISGCHNVPASSGGWLSSTNDLYKDKWWSSNCSDDNGTMLKTWYGYITNALAAEGLTDEQKARIQVEAIALRYISLKAHSVALVSGDDLAKIEADAIALGITRYSESTAIEGLA